MGEEAADGDIAGGGVGNGEGLPAGVRGVGTEIDIAVAYFIRGAGEAPCIGPEQEGAAFQQGFGEVIIAGPIEDIYLSVIAGGIA